MADGLNSVYLLGNLGADPELRQTQSSAVLSMRLACSQSYLDKNRVRQERTEWVSVVVWGRRAEALSKFLRKGAKVFVEGRLQTSSWEDREGIKRYKTEVVAENIILGGSNNPRSKPDDPERRRPSRRDDDDEQPPVDQSAPSNGGGGGGYDDDPDSDIPFMRIACPEREAWWRF